MKPATRYTNTAIVLHWLTALLILGLFPLGLYMSGLALSVLKLRLYAWHKWFGLTVLTLVLLRLGWRAGHAAPPLPASVPLWQQRIANLLHAAIYLLLLAIPLSGWAFSSAAGVPIVWWGVLPLPMLVAPDHHLAELLSDLHSTLNFTLAGLVAMHVGAALKHHFIDRDGVLLRMLPHHRKEI
jgi:cytochrome b561